MANSKVNYFADYSYNRLFSKRLFAITSYYAWENFANIFPQEVSLIAIKYQIQVDHNEDFFVIPSTYLPRWFFQESPFELTKRPGREISMFYPRGLPGLEDLFSLWSQSSENLSIFWPFLDWTSHQSHRWCSSPTILKEEQYQRHLQPTDDDLVYSSITS